MQQFLQELADQFQKYEGVRCEEVEGDLLTHNGDHASDLRVVVPCEGGKSFDFVLQAETAAGISMACKAFSNGVEIDPEIVRSIADIYGLKPVLNRKEA